MEEFAELLPLVVHFARTLAKLAKDFETECAPFQCALSTKAGTDCVGHKLRAVTDLDAAATVLNVDGIGACDHVSRSAMLERLSRMPKARATHLCASRMVTRQRTVGGIRMESNVQ